MLKLDHQICVTYQSIHLLFIVLVAELVLLEGTHNLRIVRLKSLLNSLAIPLNSRYLIVDLLKDVHLGAFLKDGLLEVADSLEIVVHLLN